MRVEIWSDLICPWCYIGKRRFEAALGRFAHRDRVEVAWRSFELDPRAPLRHRGTLLDLLAKKYGVSPEQAAAMNARVTTLAAQEGLHYRLDQARPGNTFDAHRLVYFARARGLGEALVERLMQAYFSEALAIGEREALVGVAAGCGLDAAEARTALENDAYAAEVRGDERRAAELGITGVPFFVYDGRFAVSGAQPTELFVDAFRDVWKQAG